jgi:hypothetical protein
MPPFWFQEVMFWLLASEPSAIHWTAVWRAVMCTQRLSSHSLPITTWVSLFRSGLSSFLPIKQIAESFRRFGIQDTSTHVVAVKVLKSPDQSVAEHLTTNVQGEPVALTDEALASVKDDARIRKIYRLDQPKKGESAVLGKEAEAFVIGSMALKGA